MPGVVGAPACGAAGVAPACGAAGAVSGIPAVLYTCAITSGATPAPCIICLTFSLSVGDPALVQALFNLSAVTLVVKFLPTVATLPLTAFTACPAFCLIQSKGPSANWNMCCTPASVKCSTLLLSPNASFNER